LIFLILSRAPVFCSLNILFFSKESSLILLSVGQESGRADALISLPSNLLI